MINGTERLDDTPPPPDLLARICKVNLSNAKKFSLICFPRICFRGLIYCDQEPLWLLNVIEDGCYFLGVHIRLSTRCWITSLLFDLNYKFINGSFAFSPG